MSTKQDFERMLEQLSAVLGPRFLGFGPVLTDLYDLVNVADSDRYPPHDIIQKGDNEWLIQFALAGYNPDNITITTENNILTVHGAVSMDDTGYREGERAVNVIHRGIAHRAFKQKFHLGDNIEIREASSENGILKIWLERIVPDAEKPRTIEIKTPGKTKRKRGGVTTEG